MRALAPQADARASRSWCSTRRRCDGSTEDGTTQFCRRERKLPDKVRFPSKGRKQWRQHHDTCSVIILRAWSTVSGARPRSTRSDFGLLCSALLLCRRVHPSVELTEAMQRTYRKAFDSSSGRRMLMPSTSSGSLHSALQAQQREMGAAVLAGAAGAAASGAVHAVQFHALFLAIALCVVGSASATLFPRECVKI